VIESFKQVVDIHTLWPLVSTHSLSRQIIAALVQLYTRSVCASKFKSD
jgi:hypothetical protein